jgi:hypothetical protein
LEGRNIHIDYRFPADDPLRSRRTTPLTAQEPAGRPISARAMRTPQLWNVVVAGHLD